MQAGRELALRESIDPNLAAVYAAYSRVFSKCKGGDSNAAAKVKMLINVIIAAQEPLSHATLEQMGFASFLPSLPGWGCLFFDADHRIYLLHKSLRWREGDGGDLSQMGSDRGVTGV